MEATSTKEEEEEQEDEGKAALEMLLLLFRCSPVCYGALFLAAAGGELAASHGRLCPSAAIYLKGGYALDGEVYAGLVSESHRQYVLSVRPGPSVLVHT